jgi:hypothetical protein
MSFRKFQQDDKVTYIGTKFSKELHGSVGVVDGRVGGTDTGVVVSFGGDESYVMDEKHLTRFVAKPKDDSKEESKGGPEVSKRRPKRKVDTKAQSSAELEVEAD